jgi:hypothetical protein
MPTSFRKKTAAWIAIAVMLVLAFVLMQSGSRSLSSAGGTDGAAPASPSASAARSPKVDRDRAAGRGNRSFRETLAMVTSEGPFEKGLAAEQIQAFVDGQNRSVDSLLSAFRLGGDQAFLKEAMERFPDHPQVLMTSLSQEQNAEQRLAILENLKRVDPNNALGNCMAARSLLELGRKQEALEELQISIGKPVNDFTVASAQNDEEAYLASGLSPAQAKLMALYGGSKSLLFQFRSLADGMRELRGDYQAAGDEQSVETLRGIQVGLARQLQEGGSLVDILVGMVVEKEALKDAGSEEATARLEEINQERQLLTGRMTQVTELMKDPAVPEGDWLIYFDRMKLFGEAAANDWMLEKYPER